MYPFGNVGRNALVRPGFRDLDVSLLKTISISERIRLEFRAETFNLLNHANFNFPSSLNVFSGAEISASAGVIVTTANASRQVKFGFKAIFWWCRGAYSIIG
jgi:hypothetical protein